MDLMFTRGITKMKLVWFLKILAIWFALYNVVTNIINGDASDLTAYYVIAAGGFVPTILLWLLSNWRARRQAHARK